MKRIVMLSVAIAALAGSAAALLSASAEPAGDASPIYGVKVPDGYRDWAMISVADVGAPVNDLRVKLGNALAIEAYRSGKLPFPDGAIIARLAYQQVHSPDNDAVFRAAAAKQGLSP